MSEESKSFKEVKTVLIVVYKKGIKTEDFKEAKKGMKFKKERKLKFIEQDILAFDTEEEALEVKKKLEKNKNVEFVQFDREGEGTPESLTNEPLSSGYNFHMKPNPNILNDNFDWTKLKHINDNMASKPNAVLAIIDDGAKTNHPDLAGKLLDGYNAFYKRLESQEEGIVYIPTKTHGTLCVGMAVALTNNGRDASSIGGILDNVKVLPISIYNRDGTILLSSIFNIAIDHAISRGVDAISLSWGGFEEDTLKSAMTSAYNKGIAIFTSAGNLGDDLSLVPRYPASYSFVNAIANVMQNMKLNSTSNYGGVAFVGNGSSVIRLEHNDSSIASILGGTSSASPHVASIYTAIKAVNPALTRDEILKIMKDTAFDLKDSSKFGNGYPNAVEAIRLARIRSSEFTTNSTLRTDVLNKSWTITLNKDVDSSKLKGVYLLSLNAEEFGKEHPVQVTVSGRAVTITPTKNYIRGGSYIVVVGDLYTTSGIKLNNNIAQPFSVF